MSIAKRDSSIDVLKIFAAFCVVSVHFFLNNGFYTYRVTGTAMYTAVMARTFFMICVPLFMIITGHLMCKKTLSASYYKGIKKTISIYILVSVAHILYKHFILLEEYTFTKSIFDILNFKAANYSWYIEMYIGLFLMIPFLNLAYNGLATQKQKQVLVVTCLCITSLPTIANTFVLTEPGWWANPSSSTDYTKIVPSWWLNIHPVMYYFIGCYLKEYRLALSKIKCIIVMSVTLIFASIYNFYRSYGANFQAGKWTDWDSVFTVILSVMVYLIITDTPFINKLTPKVKSILKYLSELTLGAYLLSYIFDKHFYIKLTTAIPEMPDRLPYYFIMVPLVFVCSMLLSAVINLFYEALCIIYNSVCGLFKTR